MRLYLRIKIVLEERLHFAGDLQRDAGLARDFDGEVHTFDRGYASDKTQIAFFLFAHLI